MFTDLQDALRQIAAEGSSVPPATQSVLTRALEQFPYAAELHFLNGSELAERAEFDTAVSAFRQALVLNPDLHIARFQLAFLYLVNGEAEAAAILLQPLLQNDSADSYLLFFAKGCIAAIQDNISECKQWIERGIAANTQNHALNINMEKMLALLLTDSNPQQHEQANTEEVGSALFDVYKQQSH